MRSRRVDNGIRGFLAGLLIASALHGGVSKPACAVLEAQNEVEHSIPAAADEWDVTSVGDQLDFGTRVRTGEFSRAALQLPAGSVIRLNELSAVELQPSLKDDEPARLQIRSGALFFFSRTRPEEATITTGIANGAIRGTEVIARVDARNGLTVVVLDGSVELSNPGGTLLLGPREAGHAPASNTPPFHLHGIDLRREIQWCLRYPMVLDARTLPGPVGAAGAGWWHDAVDAYTAGDVVASWNRIPESERNRPGTDSTRVLLAAIALTAGHVDRAEAYLGPVGAGFRDQHGRPLAEILAVVRGDEMAVGAEPRTAGEWLARSYTHQARLDLESARRASDRAIELAPDWGAAWARRAELAFGFSDTRTAETARTRATEEAPRLPQLGVFAGFTRLAAGDVASAEQGFEEAIVRDPGNGDALLGRGLVRVRDESVEAGIPAFLAAAALEPKRSVLRNYLARAYFLAGGDARGRDELRLAGELDPADPTVPLVKALHLLREADPIGAVRALEDSIALNDNRAVYRSRHLLDDDRALRRANLARAFRLSGFDDRALDAAQAAEADAFTQAGAQRFLADAYSAQLQLGSLERAAQVRWFNAWILANLLSRPGAGNLSARLSLNEYGSLLRVPGHQQALALRVNSREDAEAVWAASLTRPQSAWGIDLGWKHDAEELGGDGARNRELGVTWQWTPTSADSVLVRAEVGSLELGDPRVPTDRFPRDPQRGIEEEQRPFVFAGWRHQMGPRHEWIVLAGWQELRSTVRDGSRNFLLEIPVGGTTAFATRATGNHGLVRDTALATGEILLVSGWDRLEVISSLSLQSGDLEFAPLEGGSTETGLALYNPGNGSLDTIRAQSQVRWSATDRLQWVIQGGYHELNAPTNALIPPFSYDPRRHDRWHWGAGVTWQIDPSTTLRGAVAESMAGYGTEAPVGLFPTHVAGLPVVDRSVHPESIVGSVPGSAQRQVHARFERRISPDWNLTVEYRNRQGEGQRAHGYYRVLDVVDGRIDAELVIPWESLETREHRGLIRIDGILGERTAVGFRSQVSRMELSTAQWTDEGLTDPFDISAATPSDLPFGQRDPATEARVLETFAFARHFLGSGWFAHGEVGWRRQRWENGTGSEERHDQRLLNIQVGRVLAAGRGEVTLGVENLLDDLPAFRPLGFTPYPETPRRLSLRALVHF